MEKLLFSKKEIMELFHVSGATVNRMERDGRLKRLYDIPGCFYRAADVLDLCEYKDTEKGKMEKLKAKIKALEDENRVLQGKLDRIKTILKEVYL